MTQGAPVRTHNVRTFNGHVAAQARRNGFDLNKPLNTAEGDEIIVLAIDTGHPFPIVGEVLDFNANISWLARWNAAGQYRGTLAATSKHSMEKNVGDTRIPLLDDPVPAPTINSEALKMFHTDEAPPAPLGDRVKTDARKIVRDVFGLGGPRPVVMSPALGAAYEAPRDSDKAYLGSPEQQRFAKLLADTTVKAVKDRNVALSEVSVVATHALRLFALGRITLREGTIAIPYNALRTLVSMLIANPHSTAVIDTVDLPTGARFGEAGEQVPYFRASDLLQRISDRAANMTKKGG